MLGAHRHQGGALLHIYTDKNFDFLAAGETLTIVYNVTVTDDNGVSVTQPVTIIATGTNDAPVLAADASGPHTTTEGLNTTGTLTFTDVDLNDHHTVSTSVASATWSGGAKLPSGLAAMLAGALSTQRRTARVRAPARSPPRSARPLVPSISSPPARPSPSSTT
jgi:hypothetical protein